MPPPPACPFRRAEGPVWVEPSAVWSFGPTPAIGRFDRRGALRFPAGRENTAKKSNPGSKFIGLSRIKPARSNTYLSGSRTAIGKLFCRSQRAESNRQG